MTLEAPIIEVLRPGVLIANSLQIERVLGQGGFGIVYLCTDLDGNQCAVKTLLRSRLTNLEDSELFQREILRWVRLGGHPNIVMAYGMQQFMRLPFVLMEYVSGATSLADLVCASKTGWQDALSFGRQIAQGLEYAHRKTGLVHNDLKPANVLITPSGEAKVNDFGFAVAHKFEPELVRGCSPAYAAPEVWDSADKLGPRSDIYSLGILLFEVATGTLPFPNIRSLAEYGQYHANAPAQYLSALQNDVPSELASFITRCRAKDPDERPQDYLSVVIELDALERKLVGEPNASQAHRPIPRPNEVEGLVNLSVTYNNLRLHDEAARAAQAAIELDGKSHKSWVSLGNALRAKKEYKGAARAYVRANQLVPNNLLSIVNLAVCYIESGDRIQAAKWVSHALKIAKKTDSFQFLEKLLPVVLELRGTEEAVIYCDSVIRKNPLSVIALNTRAIALRRLDRLDEALRSIDQALEVNPAYATAWANRANILLQRERFLDAIESANRALDFDSTVEGGYVTKAMALKFLGRQAEGESCLKDGLQIVPDSERLLQALAIVKS